MGNILIDMAEIRDLSPSERHVVDYILENYQDVCNMGIVELGEKSFTSTTTVKRLCRKLGIDSYTNFRMMISAAKDDYMHQDILQSKASPVGRVDTIAGVIEKISQQNVSSILETIKIINPKTMEKVVELMARASRIDFYGVGPSHVVAEDASIKCLRLGISSTAFSDRVSMLMRAKSDDESGLAFLISYTGETDDIIEVAQELRSHRVTTVAITSSSANSVAKLSRYVLCVDASESWNRLGGMSSRISALSLVDALFCALINTDYDRYMSDMAERYVSNHRLAETPL